MRLLLSLLACTGQVPPAGALPSARNFHCYSWIHGPEFSTDCYESHKRCEVERATMGRDTTPCERAEHVACTKLEVNGELRCFGDLGSCERYRAYVAGNDLKTGACAER